MTSASYERKTGPITIIPAITNAIFVTTGITYGSLPLIKHGLKKERTFQLFNHEKVVSYESAIARQLHKRMTHHYKQVSHTEKYTIASV